MMRRRAYTIVELIVAMAITLVLAMIVFYFYVNISAGLQKAQREIAMLSSIRTACATIESRLRTMTSKSGYIPPPPQSPAAAIFKPLDQGLFRIQWPGAENHLAGYADGLYQDGKCRYLGFYATVDGSHVDRFELWFNPPEPRALQANGIDDDGDDDPDDGLNPLHLMRDDRGRLMLRRVKDSEMAYAQYHNAAPDGADGSDAGTFTAYRAPHLTGAGGSEVDRGDVLIDGLKDVYFEFLYSKPANDSHEIPAIAPCWPFSDKPGDTRSDLTEQQWPLTSANGQQTRGLSFIALPLAVRVRFEVEIGAETRRYEQTLLLPQSQWHEYIRRKR
jgi:prepilin-type N-terminal cleavage/methylation domain-containing protein